MIYIVFILDGKQVAIVQSSSAAEAKYDEDFQCEEDETELVEELLKFGIYGKQKTLDGIVETTKKSLSETKYRVQNLQNSFRDEQNEGIRITLLAETTLT